MIHKTAIIDSKAEISDDVNIGAYTVIGPKVKISEGSIIHAQVNISGNTTLGKKQLFTHLPQLVTILKI